MFDEGFAFVWGPYKGKNLIYYIRFKILISMTIFYLRIVTNYFTFIFLFRCYFQFFFICNTIFYNTIIFLLIRLINSLYLDLIIIFLVIFLFYYSLLQNNFSLPHILKFLFLILSFKGTIRKKGVIIII